MAQQVKATVILTKCPSCSGTFGTRIEYISGDWYRTWAFKISDSIAKNEGFDKTPVQGSLDAIEGFEGCPYCGTYGFVQCGQCKKLTCWKSGDTSVVCGWCNRKMSNIVSSDSFDVSGNNM